MELCFDLSFRFVNVSQFQSAQDRGYGQSPRLHEIVFQLGYHRASTHLAAAFIVNWPRGSSYEDTLASPR
jgi:hypothetical protein